MSYTAAPSSCKIYTPADLASAMVSALSDGSDLAWLEPSHGKGAFVEALAKLEVPKDRIVALDLDRAGCDADQFACTFRGVDFLRWVNTTELRFDRIVGNPPYIGIRHLPDQLRKVAASVVDFDEQPIGIGANLWYAFVLSSLRLLKVGGSLAFILPSAAEYANYSEGVRRAVHSKFSMLELFRCDRPLFDNVQEGTLVAIARGFESGPCKVRRSRFATRDGLIRGLAASRSRNGRQCPRGTVRCRASEVTLASIAHIHLGGVTGDASFFLMTDAERIALHLPDKALTPILSKARHLRAASVNRSAWNELKASGERIWLLNPSADVARLAAVRRYLNLTPDRGGCNRNAYKVSVRKPWYRTPLPESPDAFVSGMGRFGPWLCVNEMTRLNATNTLYVITFHNRDRRAWYGWALSLLSSTAQRQIKRMGRRYADGLVKYEPGSLGRLRLPRPPANRDLKATYRRAVDALLRGDAASARRISDAIIQQ
ncbi:MAG: hypothetical protein JWN24_4134 [Phycisphaerales bacterium]|nr:hypothetical protein [Phycisphaerales bacterium]